VGGCRRLQNEELHKLYVLPNFIRVIKSWKMRWAGFVASMGEMRHAYKILAGKHEEKKLHARPRCRWEHYNRMVPREIAWA